MTPTVSIIIPNWNGRAFLRRCVGATLQSMAASGLACELTVVDDASHDDSADAVSNEFPTVRLLRNPVNVGFGATCNRGAREAAGQVVLLVNNDLVPRETMVGELAEPILRDDGLFAVSGKTVGWDGHTPNHVNMAARINGTGFTLTYEESASPSPTMFAQGGCCAFRRDVFLGYGGFHPLFAPGYWEDYDISYRALKHGWRNLYNPRAVGNHLGTGSMVRAHGERTVAITRQRNRELFLWLNLTDPDLVRAMASRVPGRVAGAFAAPGEDRLWLRGFLKALARLPAVERERRIRAREARRSDGDIFAEFAGQGMPCP